MRRLTTFPSFGLSAFYGTIAAYLILGSNVYSPIPGLHWLLSTLAFASPAAFWIFSHAFFDEDRVLTRNNLAIAAGYVVLGFLHPPPASRGGPQERSTSDSTSGSSSSWLIAPGW